MAATPEKKKPASGTRVKKTSTPSSGSMKSEAKKTLVKGGMDKKTASKFVKKSK